MLNHNDNIDSSTPPRWDTPIESVEVHVCIAPLISPIACSDPMERKREAVWDNDKRNRTLAAIASSFANRDIHGLWDLGLFLGFEELPQPAPWPTGIAVLVEVPEHGRRLVKYLPGWRFIHANTAPVPDVPNNIIVTLMAALQFDVFCPDVLVNAIGGDWIFQIPHYGLARPDDKLIVIDIADDFDEIATRATRRRLREYTNRGWRVEAPAKWRAAEACESTE